MKSYFKSAIGVFAAACLALALGCGGSPSNTEIKTDAFFANTYQKDGIMFCLSQWSNINFGMAGTVQQLQAHADSGIANLVANPTLDSLVGNWEVVWGPVCYTENTAAADTCVSDNILVVFKGLNPSSPGDTMFVVAIAATNAVSSYDWVTEDLNVDSMALWPAVPPAGSNNFATFGAPTISGDTATTQGGNYISEGFSLTMNILLNVMQDGGQTLPQFLQAQVGNRTQATEIAVTGHSLAGAMAPVLALSLKDNQAWWNPGGNFTISTWSTAGPSPGNAGWAGYFQQQLGSTFNGARNNLDIVPYAFAYSSMLQIPTLYQNIDTALANQCLLSGVIGCFATNCRGFHYTTLYAVNDTFSTPLYYNGDSIYTASLGLFNELGWKEKMAFEHVSDVYHCAVFLGGTAQYPPVLAKAATFGGMVALQHSQGYVNHFGVEQANLIFMQQVNSGGISFLPIVEDFLLSPNVIVCE
jgi:hypothetical protein